MDGSHASHQIIADLLADKTGQHLTENRRWRVGSALSSVFREHGISNVDQLVCLLSEPKNGALSRQVVEALLNNETYFFRDRPTFEQLPNTIFPELAQRRKGKKRLSVWCAGCSTGQEVYSLALSVADAAELWDGWTIEILGTDISKRAISLARAGVYSQFEVQRGLSVTHMLEHFDETKAGWKIKDSPRSITHFEQHNVLDAPPTRQKFDLILCRNVLLYFERDTRKRVFERLHRALAPDGYLMLGAGETVVGQTTRFEPINRKASLFAPC